MNFIEVNGVSLRYDVQGSGKPLVLIHEMGGTMESWSLLAPLLSPERRIIRYDTRGAGFSEKIRVMATLMVASPESAAPHVPVQMPVPARTAHPGQPAIRPIQSCVPRVRARQ